MGNGYATEEMPTKEGSLVLSQLVSKKNKLRPTFEFIDSNYGSNIDRLFKGANNVFDFALSLRKSSGKIRRFINIAKYGVPATFMGVEFYLKLKNFIKDRKFTRSTHEKHMDIIYKLLEIDRENDWTHNIEPDVGTELVGWALSNPKTELVKILSYYNIETGEEAKNIKMEDKFSTMILLEYKKFKFLWEIEVRNNFLNIPILHKSTIYYDHNIALVEELISSLVTDYVRSFDTSKNVLVYDSGRITAKKKEKVTEIINQVDVNYLVKQIRAILANGGRRGYGIIGMQGTGKSLLVRKIEELIKDITFLHLTPDRVKLHTIDETFSIIKNLCPLIVIQEDLDSYDFKDKDDKVGKYINLMDSIKNAVFIVTINDPSKIHKTIIDRPKRFDDIIEIKPPKNEKEIYETIQSSCMALNGKFNFKLPVKSKINKRIFTLCMKNRFTQAGISSAVDKALIMLSEIKNVDRMLFNEVFFNSLVSLEDSQKALSRYRFSNKLGDGCDKVTEGGLPPRRAQPAITNYREGG